MLVRALDFSGEEKVDNIDTWTWNSRKSSRDKTHRTKTQNKIL